MNLQSKRRLARVEVVLFPAFVLWFIWQLQFTARWTWLLFVVWLAASFVAYRDNAKTLGWRTDNLRLATRQALIVFGPFAAGLIVIALILRAPWSLPPGSVFWPRLFGYFAFCVVQQVALNSLIHNRMLLALGNEWIAATLTGIVFAACHWPNPVLMPLTLIGGAAMAWMFGRVRNILPLAIGQTVLGLMVSWAFPMAWHHHLRVGPGYYTWPVIR